jgi:uncharacterized protein (TIGR02284 family)
MHKQSNPLNFAPWKLIHKLKLHKMNIEKTIDVLNSLIEINNDRIQGYDTAINETDALDLKIIFSEFQETSIKCKHELAMEVVKLGGVPTTATFVSGKLFRAWMDFKALLTANDRVAILSSCEYGEKTAVDTYYAVLDNNKDDVYGDQLAMIYEQSQRIHLDYAKVKGLHEAMLESQH